MGRPSNETKKEVIKGIKDNRKLIEDVQMNNGVNITDIISAISDTPVPISDSEDGPQHLPIHTLNEIKEKMGKKVIRQDDNGDDILVPLYNEEEKAKLVFGMLAERGINLLDHLENCLAEVGFNAGVVMSINETMSKVGDMMHSIGEIQYRKEKLANERVHLEIQKYKADLKKREIDIKEKVADAGPSNTNIVAVGSASDLLELMGSKNINNIQEANIIGEDDGEESE